MLHRCKVMMALFNEKVLKNEIPTNKIILYPSDIEEYSQNEMQVNKDPGMLFNFNIDFFFTYFRFYLDIMDDPSVPTRDRIKALSVKLVELNLQEDI